MVHSVDYLSNFLDVCLADETVHDQLVEYIPQFVWVEHKINFTYVLEEVVENLDEDLNEIENSKFAFFLVDDKDKCQSGVSSEYDFAFMR